MQYQSSHQEALDYLPAKEATCRKIMAKCTKTQTVGSVRTLPQASAGRGADGVDAMA
jgi:hypothetical protein